MRGDQPQPSHLNHLTRIGDATMKAWNNAFENANP
jgi:hypothetical protein